ncbi:hypothetical protein [Roseimaritima ulvae]|uniref:Uncharacterized protein n=1 Tax=Roseimaritima ulvae TaxID=980254 RepID=A0A5B9QUQ7_9BACT|nr:hypothetical protein [Roseimaritima ulvae]QEG42768.1 hypothetical protein UC8_48100 [Roseimaritima ulvae]
MAVRLPVILSQSAGGSNEQQGKEAGAVIQLMGIRGIDVSLIGPLVGGTLSSTDRLVLESQDRDFAIVASSSAADTIAALRSLGLRARRAPHPHDSEGEAGQGRRVFCLHWNDFNSSESLCQALQQILQDRQVVAVPISLGTGGAKPATAAPTTASPAERKSTAEPETPRKIDGAYKTQQETPAEKQLSRPATSTGMVDTDLDDLVEDLNDLNL